MSMSMPPAAIADTTGRQPGTPPAGPSGAGETRACPVCQGKGEVPADMDREQMLQALDAGMPSPENPEAGEMPENAVAPSDNDAELTRLGERAKNRMTGPRTFGY